MITIVESDTIQAVDSRGKVWDIMTCVSPEWCTKPLVRGQKYLVEHESITHARYVCTMEGEYVAQCGLEPFAQLREASFVGTTGSAGSALLNGAKYMVDVAYTKDGRLYRAYTVDELKSVGAYPANLFEISN